jgi:alanyl-tRNA synthetase
MEAAQLRQSFLNYFTERGHHLQPSASLIPQDPGLLFTIAGMVPFKPYFIGEEVAPFDRAVSIQKCFRAPDIDQIGTTARHLTFFEMLGNFSFGDYFKEDAIKFAWGLITEGLGMDPDRLWVTVHVSDTDAAGMWRDIAGVPAERIQRLDEDNFWAMGDSGPCGPCSEIFFDKGPAFGADGGPAFGGDDRFIEFWNLVFMQFNRSGGELAELPRKNIDTGSGFERLLSILNNVESVFATDLFAPLIDTAQRIVDSPLGRDAATDVSIRRIAEHGRAMTMLVGDGVLPSNEGRGYVLRRIIRRAILAARRNGNEGIITPSLVAATIEKMGEAYPNLLKDRSLIEATLQREEESFGRTLRSGMTLLGEAIADSRAKAVSTLSGETAFKLHDTHGFPIELTTEVAAESGLVVDRAGFDVEMAAQRERARSSQRTVRRGEEIEYRAIIEESGITHFVGREVSRYSTQSSVVAVLEGEDGISEVFLDASPFYAEGGGQVGDSGVIVTESGSMKVRDTVNVGGGLFAHRGTIDGLISPGQLATATIDGERRESIRRHHTATHLLHAALRSVLGDHVRQQGSLVAAERLRFDFSHGGSIAAQEMDAITTEVNRHLWRDERVETIDATRAEAEQMGAIAFFGDKYGDRVRVVRAGSSSLEFCGGTHVGSLGEIGQVQVISEGSIGSNTRRIEAVSGAAAWGRTLEMEATLRRVGDILKTSTDDVVGALERSIERQRELEKEIASIRQASLTATARDLTALAVNGVVVARVDGYSSDDIRVVVNSVRDAGVARVCIAGASGDGKVAVVVAIRDGLSAVEVVKELAGLVSGGGGGSPQLATAGGRNVDGIDELLRRAGEILA